MNVTDEMVEAGYNAVRCMPANRETLKIALSAALAAGAPGVKVKALEWRYEENCAARNWRAKTPLGSYGIFVGDDGLGRIWNSPDQRANGLDRHRLPVEELEALCQADYEARILSALEPAPPARQDTALREALALAREALIEEYASAVKRNADEIRTMPLAPILQTFREFADRLAALAQSAAPVQQAAPAGEGE